MLVFSGMTGISVQPLNAQNQNGLDFVLAQFAESGKIQAGATLPVQQGFADGGAAIYITPDVGVDPNSCVCRHRAEHCTGIPCEFHSRELGDPGWQCRSAQIYVFTERLRKATCFGPSRLQQVRTTQSWLLAAVAGEPGYPEQCSEYDAV